MAEDKERPRKPENFEEALALFARPTPKKHIKQREGWTDRQGNTHMVDYVEWHWVADVLDWATPTWQFRIDDVSEHNGVAVVTASIGIEFAEGVYIWRSGVGTGTPKGQGAQGQETAYKKAESDALKRAAVKFGLARDLYQGEEGEVRPAEPRRESSGGNQRREARDDSPPPRRTQGQSTSGGDEITPKQLNYAKSLARDAGKDVDELANEWSGGEIESIEDMSRKDATKFIDWLKETDAF